MSLAHHPTKLNPVQEGGPDQATEEEEGGLFSMFCESARPCNASQRQQLCKDAGAGS
jgi:hypothetical protein